jgi:CRP-like cAMP-binding protein
MVLNSLIRWSPFFSELKDEQVAHIARAAHEEKVESGHIFFHEGEELDTFYLLKQGSVNITISVPDRNQKHSLVDQITHNLKHLEAISVSTIGVGDIFGWSALVPPCKSTANAIASTPCHVIAVDCRKLRPIFEEDRDFAYSMVIKAAQTIRSRLRDRRIESLAFV